MHGAAASAAVLTALVLAPWAVCSSQAKTQPSPRAAFAAMPRTEFLRCPAPWGSPALKLDRPVCPLQAVRQAGGDCQSLGSLRRVQMPRHRRGAVGLRAQAGDGSLRDEFEKMLGSSGRDQGLKGMKAPKGSIEWLKQQQAKDKARNVSPAASPTGDGDSASSDLPISGPPLSRPKPAPTYQELDSLLSGKSPTSQPTPEDVSKSVPPVARPSYSVSSGGALLASFDKGDAVPEAVWDLLTGADGQSLSLSTLASEGAELLLLVPESAHHTGAPSETWTKLLIDLQNTLGSRPDKVKAVAVSPEPPDVHIKMMKNYNLKLFTFASDVDREFLAAHKVWDPDAAGRGVSVERQTFIVDTATKKFAHVFNSVPAVGHAEAVRDVLHKLQESKAQQTNAEAPALAAPPPKPAPAVEPAAPEAGSVLPEISADASPAQILRDAPTREKGADEGGEAAQQANPPDGARERGKAGEVEEVFELAVDSVSPLIGRGGTRVKELALMTGASIRFENEPSPRMFVRGTPEQRVMAFGTVKAWIDNTGIQRVPMALELHGRLIGSGGTTIKQIEWATRAHVLFEREPEPCMVVRGNATERAAAIAMAMDIVDTVQVEEEKIDLCDVIGDRTHVRAMLGFKGAFIKRLESEACVKVRYNLKEEDDNKFLILSGNAEQRAMAKQMVEEHLEAIKEVSRHKLNDDELRSLMGYKGSVVHRLEEGSGAIISMERLGEQGADETAMLVRGTRTQRDKAWELARDVLLNDAIEMHDIPSNLRRVVVGPGGAVIKRVENETGASITLLNDNEASSRVMLRGRKDARSDAWQRIQDIVSAGSGVDTIVVDRRTTTELLRNKARRCKELELATGTYISVEKEEGTQTPKTNGDGMTEVIVRGLPEQREIVKQALEEMLLTGPEKHLLKDLAGQGVDITILDVRRIIGPRGSRVSEMEEATGASIRLEVEPEPFVSIMGSREQKDAALAAISASLLQDDQEFVPLPESMHGVIIGVSGRSVQMIEKKSGAQVSFRQGEEAAMVLRGDPSQRALARELAEQLVAADTAEHFVCEERQASALIGMRGKNVRSVESATGARVQVLSRQHFVGPQTRVGLDDLESVLATLDENQALVVIKGTEDQRAKARGLVEKMMEPEEADEEMQLTGEQSEMLTRLRGAARRDIEERTGARLMLNEAADAVVVFGRVDERAAAREALAVEFALEEESRQVTGSFPLLMLRLIVGAGGANVRTLEKASGARIRFEKDGDGPEANVMLKVRGSAEARAQALKLIAEEEAKYSEQRMPLPVRKHFLLIGRGGEVVKDMERTTNTAICFTGEPEAAMVVLGTPENNARAIQVANQQLSFDDNDDQELFQVPKEYHAEIIGASGRSIQAIESQSGALIHFKGDDTDDCIITGSIDQRAQAWKAIQQIIDGSQVSRLAIPVEQHRIVIGPRGNTIKDIEHASGARLSFEEGDSPGLVARGDEEARSKALELVRQVLEDDGEEHFYVERRYHGWLIGPRGSRIRDIEQEAGTRVLMSRDEPVVIVQGSKARREKAWELIQTQMDLMDEVSDLPENTDDLSG